MIIRVCAFTEVGRLLAEKIASANGKYIWEHKCIEDNTDEWVKDSFDMKAPLVFISAAGIAVRKIAPFVTDKLTDSPVVVIDEKGKFVIPILSGHVGGANELAEELAESIGAEVVITTATDIEGIFSVDVFAVKNGFKIINRDGIKKVSSKILSEGMITVAVAPSLGINADDATCVPECIRLVDYDVDYDEDNMQSVDVVIEAQESNKSSLLTLAMKPYIIGIGCKKNTDKDKFEAYVLEVLASNNIDIDDVCAMASIDLKKKEYAPVYFETKYRVPYKVYSADELCEVEGDFTESEFVKSITGVSNVCERAAVRCAGEDAELIVKKQAYDGMTVAVAKKRKCVFTWET